jgi:hypothetical protein
MMNKDSFLVTAADAKIAHVKCSVNDHLAFSAPVSVLYFYHQIIHKDVIINALKTALHDFPIFAGRLFKSSEALWIHCENQGVQVSSVWLNGKIAVSLSDLQGLDALKFVDLIDPFKALKNQLPLLTIKLSYAEEGMVIGYCWHHSLGDMATFMLFLKALSATAQGKSYPLPYMPLDRACHFKQHLEEKITAPVKKERAHFLKFLTWVETFQLLRHVYAKRECVYFYFSESQIRTLQELVSQKAGIQLSRNVVLCAHLLALTSRYRKTKPKYTSFALNMRPRLQLPSNLLGNFSDLVSVLIDTPHHTESAAKAIHQAIENYEYNYFQETIEIEKWTNKNGALKKLCRFMPTTLLPKQNQLVITNWMHFGVYTIDFGVASPYLFLPVGAVPLPWVSCIVEGFDNQGLLVALVVPSTVAKSLLTDNSNPAHSCIVY